MIQCRNIFLLLMILSLSGCTTLGSLQRNYDRIIFQDGIDKREARTIAIMVYLKGNEYKNYRIGSAKVYSDSEILRLDPHRFSRDLYTEDNKQMRFQDSWYVLLRPKFLSLFSNYYLIAVDKKDGVVLYERDSNVLAELFESVFRLYIEPRLACAMAVGFFYKDKKEVPENVEVLKHFLEQSPDAKIGGDRNLTGMKFEKVSSNKLKVFYVTPGFDKVDTDPSEIDKLFGSSYELEIETQGEKVVMKISGDYEGTLDFSDRAEPVEQSLSPAVTP